MSDVVFFEGIASERNVSMKKLLFALLATGALAAATPALAQGVYFGAGPGGVGVGVDAGPRYYRDGYREYGDGYRYGTYGSGVVVREGGRRCRTTIIRNEFGERRRITRCW
jgi:hypothetical protein